MAKKITKIIKVALIEKELTIPRLAKQIGRSRVYVSNVINDRFSRRPEETLRLIADALDLNYEELTRAA